MSATGDNCTAALQPLVRNMLHLSSTGKVRDGEPGPARARDMEREIIFLIEKAPDGGYTARALVYNAFAKADSFAGLKGMTQEALQCRFETEEMPPLIRLHMVDDEFIAG